MSWASVAAWVGAAAAWVGALVAWRGALSAARSARRAYDEIESYYVNREVGR